MALNRRYQKKQRRLNRDKLSIECKEALEAIYLKEEYPKRQTLESLAKTWNTDYPTLYNWFYRRCGVFQLFVVQLTPFSESSQAISRGD